MIAYRYNPDTKIYEGTQPCQRDPVASERAGKDVYLLPGNCTYVEPPEAKVAMKSNGPVRRGSMKKSPLNRSRRRRNRRRSIQNRRRRRKYQGETC